MFNQDIQWLESLHCYQFCILPRTSNDRNVCIAITFAFYQKHQNVRKICIDVTFAFYQDFKCQESLSSVENSCVFKVISSVESRGCSKSYIQQSCSTRTRTRVPNLVPVPIKLVPGYQHSYPYPYPGTHTRTHTRTRTHVVPILGTRTRYPNTCLGTCLFFVVSVHIHSNSM